MGNSKMERDSDKYSDKRNKATHKQQETRKTKADTTCPFCQGMFAGTRGLNHLLSYNKFGDNECPDCKLKYVKNFLETHTKTCKFK